MYRNSNKARVAMFRSFSNFNNGKNKTTFHFKAKFTTENVIAGLIGSGIGLFNVAAINYLFPGSKEKKKRALVINTNNYLYHSIGSFDLFKLASILNNGILSKSFAEEKGIIISSNGETYNGKHRVSLATAEVLQTKAYAGEELSLIVDEGNLEVLHPREFMPPEELEDAISYERQVHGVIPKENIMGIMIPNNYLCTPLTDLTVFRINAYLKNNINNLNNFIRNEFSISLFSDLDIKKYYEEAITRQNAISAADKIIIGEDIMQSIRRQSQEVEKTTKMFRDKERISTDLNKSLMKFIINLYAKKLGKREVTLVDIVHYHTLINYQGYELTPMSDLKLSTNSRPQNSLYDLWDNPHSRCQNRLYLKKLSNDKISYTILSYGKEYYEGIIHKWELEGISNNQFERLHNSNIKTFKEIEKSIFGAISTRNHVQFKIFDSSGKQLQPTTEHYELETSYFCP